MSTTETFAWYDLDEQETVFNRDGEILRVSDDDFDKVEDFIRGMVFADESTGNPSSFFEPKKRTAHTSETHWKAIKAAVLHPVDWPLFEEACKVLRGHQSSAEHNGCDSEHYRAVIGAIHWATGREMPQDTPVWVSQLFNKLINTP